MHLLLLTLYVSLLTFPLAPVRQTDAAIVRPEQASYMISTGAETIVTVRLENATDVYGIDVRASFDPALVEVVDADAGQDGVQIEPGEFPRPDFVMKQDVDPGLGTVRYVIIQVNPTPPASGSGVLFTVRLRGRGSAGSGEFRIDGVEMSDRAGNLLPVEWSGATLQVDGAPAAGQGAAPTGVAIAPTSPPEAPSATPTSETNTTPPPATDVSAAPMPEPNAAATQPPATTVSTLAAETSAGVSPPPATVSASGAGTVVEAEPATNDEAAASTTTVDELVAAAPRDPAATVPATTAPTVTGRNNTGTALESVNTPEPELAVVGEGQAIAGSAQSPVEDASAEPTGSIWTLLLAVGLAVLAAVGVAFVIRRSA